MLVAPGLLSGAEAPACIGFAVAFQDGVHRGSLGQLPQYVGIAPVRQGLDDPAWLSFQLCEESLELLNLLRDLSDLSLVSYTAKSIPKSP